jgi:uncharacterized protein (DUF362 family)
MENIVHVVRGKDPASCFRSLLSMTQFNEILTDAFKKSSKSKDRFQIAVKPNMMVFVNPRGHEALVTSKDLVESLVDHIRDLGFSDIAICEAQNDIGQMFRNHNVRFVAEQIGYKADGRYRIVDLTLESEAHSYEYCDPNGKIKTWTDTVGKTWKEADFRISFAKCKTHEQDWMTLSVKNVYGCFPNPGKVCRYHIRYEVPDVTARSLRNFPVHFAFVDAWIGSDGFQGYKLPNPRPLHMLFGGWDPVAVDMEIFERAGLDPRKSQILAKTVEQIHGGHYPDYTVQGDRDTKFHDIGTWQNVPDHIVRAIDTLEEIYVAWGLINMKPGAAYLDYSLFPPKNILSRVAVWITKKLYSIFKLTRFFKKLYHHEP